MDLPDIARLLSHPDDVLKVQALTALLAKLDSENNDPAFRKQLQLLYEAMQSPTAQIADVATEWIAARATATVDELAKFPPTLGRILKDFDALFTEIFARVKKAVHRRYLYRLAFAIVESQDEAIINDPKSEMGFIRVFLRFASLVPDIEIATEFFVHRSDVILNLVHSRRELNPAVTDWLLRLGFEKAVNKEKFFECVEGLLSQRHYALVQQHVGDYAVQFWLRHIESLVPSSMITAPSNYESVVFVVARILISGSADAVELLRANNLILPSPLLVLPLFNFIYVQNQFVKAFPSNRRMELVGRLTLIFRKSSELAKECQFGKPPTVVRSIGEWLADVVAKKQASTLLNEWTIAKSTNSILYSDVNGLLVLVTLFPFVETAPEREKFLNLLRATVTQQTEALVVNFHMCQVTLTDDLPTKNDLIASVAEIPVNDRLTKQIVKFLYAFAQLDGTFEAAFNGLESIFKRDEAIFTTQEVQALLQIPKEGTESAEKTAARFRLMKAVCPTEWGEKLVSKVVKLIQERSDVLKDAIDCATNLSSIEMIEIGKLRKIILPKVSKPGQEAALAAYCHFLATSVIDEDEEDLAVDCAAELWAYRVHASPIVREAAYSALKAFKAAHLPETLVSPQENPTAAPQFLSGVQVFDGIGATSQDDAVFAAFGKFLSKALTIDVNQLSRKHFVAGQGTTTNESPLFVALIPVLRDVLQGGDKGLIALELVEPLTRTVMPVSKKVVRCNQILTSAIAGLDVNSSDFDASLKALVTLKAIVDLLYAHTRESNAAINKRLTCFDAARSVSETLTKAVSDTSKAAELALFGMATIYNSLEATVFSEAAIDPLKRAFLPENLKHLATFRRQVVDVAARVIDPTFKAVTSDFKFDSSSISTDLAVFVILYTLNRSQMAHDSSEELALTLAKSHVEASVTPDGSVLSLVLTSFNDKDSDDPTVTLVRALQNRELLSDEQLASFKPRTVKLLAQLFSVDVALIDLLLARLPSDPGAENRFIGLKDSSDVEALWESFTNLPDALHTKYAPQLAKRLEKIVKSDKSKLLPCAAGLADYCAVFHAGIKARQVLLADYSRLPERSILRHAVTVAAQKDTPIGLRGAILKAFIGIRRTDSTELPYRLPLLDWHAFGWSSEPSLRASLLAIAVEQLDAKLLYQLTKDPSTKVTFEDLVENEKTLASELSRLADTLPNATFTDFIEVVIEKWHEANWPEGPVSTTLADLAERRPEVLRALRRRFPDFDTPADLLKPIIRAFALVPGILSADIATGKLGELWKELARGDRMDLAALLRAVDWNGENRKSAILLTSAWLRDRCTAGFREQLMKRLAHVVGGAKEADLNAILGLFLALLAAEGRLPLILLSVDVEQQYEVLLNSIPGQFRQINDLTNPSKILQHTLKLPSSEHDIILQCLRIALSQSAISPFEIDPILLNEAIN
uniref:Nucleolar pre-ribosomal-associated protein 2 n=1 Tax=Panagrellus redivivus TaxID=6233 RepID=A0A7E4VPV3_PANRE